MANREHSTEILPHFRVIELFRKSLYTQIFDYFSEQNFEEHSVCWGSGVLLQDYDFHYLPINTESKEKMAVKLAQISNFVDLQFEHSVIVIYEGPDEKIFVDVVNFAKSLG